MRNLTRTGEMTSLQVGGVIKPITNLATENFSLRGKQSFLIKNDGSEEVTLEVNLPGMEAGEFTSTKFPVSPRWSPEIVREIKVNASAGDMDLKYGF